MFITETEEAILGCLQGGVRKSGYTIQREITRKWKDSGKRTLLSHLLFFSAKLSDLANEPYNSITFWMRLNKLEEGGLIEGWPDKLPKSILNDPPSPSRQYQLNVNAHTS